MIGYFIKANMIIIIMYWLFEFFPSLIHKLNIRILWVITITIIMVVYFMVVIIRIAWDDFLWVMQIL